MQVLYTRKTNIVVLVGTTKDIINILTKYVKQIENSFGGEYMKLKKWLRKKYLIWKYKHNYDTGMIIVSKLEDRGLGLTTMMIDDCLSKHCMLLVPNAVAKYRICEMIYNMFNSPTCTSSIDPNDYVVTPTEIANGKLQGRHNVKIIIDNQCTYHDFTSVRNSGYEHSILNGFVYIPFAA